MRKVLRITAWILALIVLAFMAGLVAIQSPRVQTAVGRKVVQRLQKNLEAEITFNDLTLRPFDALVFHDVVVLDRNPQIEGLDTLARVGTLSAKFSLWGLVSGDGAYLSHARLEDALFQMGVEPDSLARNGTRTNLQRVFKLPYPDPDKVDKGWGNLLTARELVIRRFHFRLINPLGAKKMAEKGIEYGPESIDWNRLDATLSYARAHHVRVADSRITGSVDSLSARENRSGFQIRQASAQKVSVGQKQLRIDKLKLQDRYSQLNLNRVQLDGDISEYSQFIDRIRLNIDVREGTEVSMQTVSFFGPRMEELRFRGRLKGRMSGYVTDFALKNVSVEDLDNPVQIKASGRILGVTDIQNSLLDMEVTNLSFTLNGLAGFVKSWAPKVQLDLQKMAPGEVFSFAGTAKGPLNRLEVNGEANSGIGKLKTGITVRNTVDTSRPMILGGRLETADLNIGRIIGVKALGPLTLKTNLDAALKPGGPEVRIDTLRIDRLHALGYDYSNITASGNYSSDAFDGRIKADDPNLNLFFQGLFNLSPSTRDAAYRFDASLDYADLHALKLDSRPQSKISFQAASNIVYTGSHELIGDVTVNNLSLESASGAHALGNINVKAHAKDSTHRIRITSDFLNGNFVGEQSVTAFINDLRYLILDTELNALSEKHAKPWNGSSYALNLQVRNAYDLLDFLAPGAYVANPTDLSLTIDRAGIVRGQLESGRIAFKDKYIKDLQLSLDNEGDALQASLSGSTLQVSKGSQLLDNHIAVFADNNHVGMGCSFDNGEEESTRAELFLTVDLDRDKDGLIVKGKALPSNVYYKGAGWGVSSGEILYQAGNVKVNRLLARHEDEILLVDGGFSPTRPDTLSVSMEKFDMRLVNTITGGTPPLSGFASGQALVISPKKPSIGLVAQITCDSTYVSGRKLGKLDLDSRWDEESNSFRFGVKNHLDGLSNVDLTGSLVPKGQLIQATAKLDRFDLGYAAPFLNTVFSTLGGSLSGDINVGGSLKNLQIHTPGLRIEEGRMALDFTRALYTVEGTLGLDQNALYFTDLSLKDQEGGHGTVEGSIGLGGFKNLSMDTHVRFQDMRVLDLPKGANPTLFGNVYATGRADITGPLNRLLVDVSATTTKQGDLHLPLGSSSGERERNLLVFTEADLDEQVDPYELMMAANEQTKSNANNLTIKLTARATPDVTAYIDIGDENSLNGSGSGTVNIEMQSAQHSFSLGGDYTLQEGSFHFSAMNLVSRDFTIQNGSSVRFNGAIMDTDLNVKGLYTTKANLANLISSSEVSSESGSAAKASNRRTVNCGIDITGKLRNPEISFSIDVPDLSPSAQLEVQSALNSEDKIQKQFLYLLIAGSFLPSEESGITTDGSEMLYSNVSSIMSGQINNIFAKLDIPLDLGLNYQATQEGKNLFDVAVSTQLFNNRVIVNGAVGNKQRIGSTSANELAGDLDIEVKMNRSGALRMTFFSHSADQFSSYLDNSQRNGVGITYQREFNSVGQFFRELFSTRKQREERAARRMLSGIPQTVLQIDSLGQTKVIAHEQR
ncbi:MAG: translocation/assembly module TamB domain-containing protein [Bacteroidales bacterium]|nr:translocation/assembly module TamB domain-containing protein [Bacteroidales bacterium]